MKINRVEIINYSKYGNGRDYVMWKYDIEAEVELQDGGKTLNVFIRDAEKNHKPECLSLNPKNWFDLSIPKICTCWDYEPQKPEECKRCDKVINSLPPLCIEEICLYDCHQKLQKEPYFMKIGSICTECRKSYCSCPGRQPDGSWKPQENGEFSKFFITASDEEKIKVLTEAAKMANKDQKRVMEENWQELDELLEIYRKNPSNGNRHRQAIMDYVSQAKQFAREEVLQGLEKKLPERKDDDMDDQRKLDYNFAHNRLLQKVKDLIHELKGNGK